MEFFEDWPRYFDVAINWSDRLLDGLWTTIQLTIFGGILAFVVAVVLGLIAGSPRALSLIHI